jgi:hypothetical protein
MKRTITAFALAMLSACGGGGGGGTPPPANLSSAPGEAALAAYLQTSHQTTLTASDTSGNSYTLQISSQPNSGTTTFNGAAPAYSTVDTLTLSKNGVVAASNISTGYYLLNPYVPLGTTDSTGTPYQLVTSSTPLPATLNVGNSGPVDNLNIYHDSTMASLDAESAGTYSVEPNNSTTLLMCLNFVISNVTAQGTADGLADTTETDCYSVDASGKGALFSIAISVNGVTLNFN